MTTVAAPRRQAYGTIPVDVDGARGATVLPLVLLLAIGLGVVLVAVAIMSASIDVAHGLSPYAPGAPDLVRRLA